MQKHLSKSSLETFLKSAKQALSIGDLCLNKHFGKVKNIELKDKSNYVSAADLACEKLIFEFLKKRHPEVEFLGEETHFLKKQGHFQAADGFRWILDPLDGTTNFVHAFPFFCISLALELNGKIILGAIHAPVLKQTFTAIKNHGAFLNGKKIQVSKKNRLSDAFAVTGLVNQSQPVLSKQLKIVNKMIWEIDALRRSGSAALDLAYVAQGVFDFYWEENVKPWDIAAGLLLVEEAGGLVCNYKKKNITFLDSQIIAGNPKLVRNFIKRIHPIL